MRAAILSIGDELTLGQNVDTNSAWIAARLAERSILSVEHRTVADDRAVIGGAIEDLTQRIEALIITGGLGPTDDDLTREALGDVLTPGRQPVTDADMLAHIERRFAQRGKPMPPMNRKQATRPETMRSLPNPNGTAPGLFGKHGGCWIASLPGPPREMQPMFLDHVLPSLPIEQGDVIASATVHEIGLGESDAAQRLGSLMDRNRQPLVGITVSDAIVSARIRSVGEKSHVLAALEETSHIVEQAWVPYVFGRDQTSLAQAVGELLRASKRTLATAESCTGGLLGKMIVDVAGSSDYYKGGWVTYSNQMKHEQLGVPLELLERHGAVSEPVAAAMAAGALRASGADHALSITGIAGPVRTNAPSEKPVGTVFIAHAHRLSDRVHTVVRRFQFPGDRIMVRDRSAKYALQMLRLSLLHQPSDVPLMWDWIPRE